MLRQTLNKEQNGMFGATLAFRWAALFHVLLLLVTRSSTVIPLEKSYLLLGIASFFALMLTIFKDKITANGQIILAILFIDIFLSFALMTLGGGWRSSWYLYTFSSALMAAVFYKVYGALIVSALLGVLHIISLLLNGMTVSDMMVPNLSDQIISNVVSYLLGGCIFGYPAILIERLTMAKNELELKNKQLEEADKVMAELETNTNDLREIMTDILEPQSILKLLVARQNKPVNTSDTPLLQEENDVKLTKRELEFLELLAKGMNNSDIATVMHISKRTVETHRKNVFQKLGANSAAHALFMALQCDLIDKQSLVGDKIKV